MNENILQTIGAFAKANKISKAKVEALVTQIIGDIKPAGRPVKEGTQACRDAVYTALKAGKSLSMDIQQHAGIEDAVSVCNALNWLEKQGKARRIGVDTSKQGKGKKPIIWTAI